MKTNPMLRTPLALLLPVIMIACQPANMITGQEVQQKYRTIILTDQTHDDGNSLIRYLYYSSHFDTEAIIVTPQLPDFNYDDDGPWEKAQSILNAYRQEYDQLKRHDPGLPAYEELVRVTKRGRGALPIIWLTHDRKFSGQIYDRFVESSWGEIRFGDWIGEGETPNGEPKDSEGSEFLIEVFEKEDDRPIFIQFWGGPVTFMQALYRYEERYGKDRLKDLLGKLIVYTIHMQDITIDYMIDLDLVREAGCLNLGEVRSEYDGERVTPRIFMADEGHFWKYLDAVDRSRVNGHGPLSDLYDGGGEGDTPSFLNLVSAIKGLNDPIDPTHGSWGNMFHPMGGNYPDGYFSTCPGDRNELERWIPDATNSFMARLQWSVKGPEDVNRAPVAVLNGDKSNRVMRISAEPGGTVELDASGSYDPNGGEVRINWFHYVEADTWPEKISIENPASATQTIRIPDDLSGREIHIVLEVRDNGEPQLASYRRVILKE
jgi:hypothetical protein